jgi:hypothetical protein
MLLAENRLVYRRVGLHHAEDVTFGTSQYASQHAPGTGIFWQRHFAAPRECGRERLIQVLDQDGVSARLKRAK